MAYDEKTIRDVTQHILHMLSAGDQPAVSPAPQENGCLFEQVNDAVEAAWRAQKELIRSSLAKRAQIIENIRKRCRENVERLSSMEVEETGMGCYEDKVVKHTLTLDGTPGIEDIQTQAVSGDNGLMLVEQRPFGVGGCILPSTAPSCTAIHNSICMIASGNGAVLSPHPGALKTTQEALRIIHEAIVEAGGPGGIITSTCAATMENANALISHPKVNFLLATGGPGVVKAVLASGKKAIAAGPGNPPVLVDETADIEKAAREIIMGNSFENCIQCIGEKEVFAVNCIADDLIRAMTENCGYLIEDANLIDRLTALVTDAGGHPNKKYVGKSASAILRDLGLTPPNNVRTIIFETTEKHPIVVAEYLMPLLPIVRVKNVREGIDKAIAAEGGNRHSAMVHSHNVVTLTRYAQELQTTILVKNGPSYAGLGLGGEGYVTMSLAGPTGEGLTSPRTFTRAQRCSMVGELNLRTAMR